MIVSDCRHYRWLSSWSSAFILLFLLIPSMICLDELLSTRCQSKCLYDMEQYFKCTTPCREAFIDVTSCLRHHCQVDIKTIHNVNKSFQHVASTLSCEKSCKYLSRIQSSKAGHCPRPIITTITNECVSSCRHDGDCEEDSTQKCCSNGCDRSCIEPNQFDDRVLPVPIGIEIEERKRGRSAVIRWELPAHDHHQTHLNNSSGLYVLQWRWGVQQNNATMTRWQTVVVRNKKYAILKHLLSPGRYYSFRIAAINVHGSRGYSVPSPLFKLSKAARPPSEPRNLTLNTVDIDKDGRWTVLVKWRPPSSDFPIVHYQVMWTRFDDRQQIATNKTTIDDEIVDADRPSPLPLLASDQSRRSAILGAEDLVDQIVQNDDERTSSSSTTLLSADDTFFELHNLEPSTQYAIEVTAIAETESGKLSGDKSSVSLKTPSILPINIISTTLPSSSANTHLPIDTVDAIHQHPHRHNHYHRHNQLIVDQSSYSIANGQLQLSITLPSPTSSSSSQQLLLKWCPINCTKSQCGEKSVLLSSTANQFELEHLQFSCNYSLSLIDEDTIVSVNNFVTPKCLTINCTDTPIPPSPTSFNCSVLFIDAKSAAAICTWRASTSDIDSYRIQYRRVDNDDDRYPMRMRTIAISVGQRYVKTVLSALRVNQLYRVQVQAITIDGRYGAIAELTIDTTINKHLLSINSTTTTTTTSVDDVDVEESLEEVESTSSRLIVHMFIYSILPLLLLFINDC